MFVAIDQYGNKYNPIETEEHELRLLSKSKSLFCPECASTVRFASGEQITAHFKHVHSPDCTYDSEPETEEHLKGKMFIRNWLVDCYPGVQVEFEYKIIETNQRADVLAIFPEGKRIAFEMQCSKIQGSVWKERHALYKKAGIQDLWILGETVHKYGKTNGEEDPIKHQLVSLASTIYQKEDFVLFLDTKGEKFRGLYKHKFRGWHSDTILKLEEEIFPLNSAQIYKKFIATDSIKSDFKKWYLRKLEKDKKEIEREKAYRREEEKRQKEYERELYLRDIKMKQYLTDLNLITIDKVREKMTNKEKELFDRLLKKHGYEDMNFPGLFNVFTDHNHLIKTPPQLWQLWIYDQYIYRKHNEKIWIPKIKDHFYKMRESGVFRFKYKSNEQHYSFAIYGYFESLNLLGIVEQLGYYSTKYHSILANELPPYSGKELHNNVRYYLSFHNDFSIDVPKDIKEFFLLYKDMIKRYEEFKQPQESFKSSLEYASNLFVAQPKLGNEWEKEFIVKMLGILKKGYNLSEKQETRARSIVMRIEKTLKISLSQSIG